MKKLISVLLSLVMIFTVAMPAFASERVNGDAYLNESYDSYPVIIVRGINFGGLINTEDSSLAMQFKAEDIFSLLKNIFTSAVFDKNKDAFIDSVITFVWDLMGSLASDKDGTSLDENISALYYHEALSNYDIEKSFSLTGEDALARRGAEIVGDENTYFFNYDWRLSPEELADELNDLVETAKKDSGKDKVRLICASMGGMVGTAYFYYHGYESVESCTYFCSAHNGTYVVGDALSGNIEIIPEAVDGILSGLVASQNNQFLSFIMKVLRYSGIYQLLSLLLNKFISANIDKVYDAALRDIFATSVGLWGLCPDEYYDTAVDFIFSGKESEYPVLLEKLDECGDFVKSTEKTLENAEKAGIKLTFISNYNLGLVPVYEKSVLHGDRVLETELTSNFAVVAPYGETLSEEYLATADSAFVSPDKIIDASKALYRDRTWFVKNAAHVCSNYGTQYCEFVFDIALSENQPTIKTFPEYPQFMIADAQLNLLPLAE